MNDERIITLFFDRDEQALAEVQKKYGTYCHTVAYGVLNSHQDAEECVNDTYLQAWNAIPPQRPQMLSAFLAKITRNLALMRYRAAHREKRGGGQLPVALEELQDCLPEVGSGHLTDAVVIRGALNDFLHALPEPSRGIFLRRYWYVRSIPEIAQELGMKESRVKMTLLRTRERLREHLLREGIEI